MPSFLDPFMEGKAPQRFDCFSDRQLVKMLIANDEAAVQYVFFQRCDNLFSHILGIMPPDHANKKEELISDFYLFLREDDWRRLRQFQFRSRIDTWLSVTAIRFFNSKISVLQTKKRALDALNNDTVGQIPDQYDLIDEMSRLELYEAIEQLPKPRERFALLGELAGKSAEEISKELGCTVTAVYNLTKKARLALKKRMKGHEK